MQRAREWWDSLGRGGRIRMSAASVGIFAALTGFLLWTRPPDYVPLSTNLSTQESNAVLSTLREAGIPFRLEQGGATISVPAQRHDEALVKITHTDAPPQKDLAETKRAELQSLIDSTIGPRKAVVLVNAEINPDQEETQTSTNGAEVATSIEELNGPGASRRSAAGGSSLPPPTSGSASNLLPSAGGVGGRFVHRTATRTSEPSHVVRRVVKGPGHIDRLTVSALIDWKVNPAQVAAIKQALETAIAVDPKDLKHTRRVTIAQVPFDHSSEEAAARIASEEDTLRWIRLAVPLAVLIPCLFLLGRTLRKPVPFAEAQMALETEGAARIGQTAGFGLRRGHARMGLPSGRHRPGEINESAFEANLSSIQQITQSNPETVALLISSWIHEES